MTESRSSHQLWAQAAVFGGLWGGVEITLGGFLHTLRVPLCGVLMAALQAGYMVAVRVACGRRGVIVAMAAVAALVRGLAPVGAFFTPMIGIFSEGLIMELAFLLLPGVWAPALVGGAVCPLLSVAQFVIYGFLFFGLQMVQLYDAVYQGAEKVLGASWASFSLAVPLLIMAGCGALCGAWGVRLGKMTRERVPNPQEALFGESKPQEGVLSEKILSESSREVGG